VSDETSPGQILQDEVQHEEDLQSLAEDLELMLKE